MVSWRQLRAAGLHPSAIRRCIADEILRSLHRGVYALAHRQLDRSALQRAGELAVGSPCAVSHADAASAWSFARSPTGPVELTLPGRSGRGPRPGITLHRASLPPGDWVVRDGMRVTTPPRTLIDLAARSAPRELERALDEAHFRGLVSAPTLAEALERNRWRPGVAPLRRLLATHELGSTRTETGLEERVLALLRAAGLRHFRCQVPIGPYRVDVLFEAERVVVEADGHAAHGRATRRAEDALRDADLEARGYEVVRITEDEAYGEPGPALGRVAAALSARRPSPAGSPACPSP